MAGEIDPTGQRKKALDEFLEAKVGEGFRVETHTETHAIVVAPGDGPGLFNRVRRRRAGRRFVISVDEHGEVTMIPAEPKRS